jgi:hypothetical protein
MINEESTMSLVSRRFDTALSYNDRSQPSPIISIKQAQAPLGKVEQALYKQNHDMELQIEALKSELMKQKKNESVEQTKNNIDDTSAPIVISIIYLYCF